MLLALLQPVQLHGSCCVDVMSVGCLFAFFAFFKVVK
jgi:hypothetical protein